MKHYRSKIKFISSFTAAMVLLLIVSLPAAAQRASGNSSAPRRSAADAAASQRAMTQQELLLRGAVKDKTYDDVDNDAGRRATLLQIKEDFERIQFLNDGILGILKTNTGFNLKNIGEMTGEIKKRAKRFKDNANLPPPTAEQPAEQKKFDQISREELKDALVQLNKRINRFVENPLFQTPQWADVKQGGQASRDLATIIEWSGQLKKSAERLSKLTP